MRQSAELGIPFATNEVRAIVEWDDLEALAIVTPTPSHHPLVIRALASGKHVLAEKPMAMDANHELTRRKAAAEARVTAMMNFE
jgi:myo-inositol 2-dehydrogenase/D-chiro-inositol 1-dehydrogenase